MKQLLTFFAALMLISSVHAEDDWQTMENNFKFQGESYGLEIRTYADDDYDHAEVTYKLAPNLTGALRLAEDGTDTEIRPKLTHKVFNAGPISLAHRIEYRYFEGSKDDNWRYRGIVKAEYGGAWLKMQPRWTFGAGKTGDMKIDDVKWQAGYDIAIAPNLKLTPFVEYLTAGEDGDWQKEHLIGGTTVQVKF